MSLIYTHLFLSLSTFVSGLYVFVSKQNFSFKNLLVIGYVHLHLSTAITGLLLGDLHITKFSPFQWLSVLTIGSYILCVIRIFKGNFARAGYPMLGAYFGLCIAFAGALHPGRLAGYRLWTKTFQLSSEQANNFWIALMVLVTVPCVACIVYFNIIEFRSRKHKLN